MRLVSACLALCLLLPRFSPCEGRRLLVAEEEGGTGKVMHSEADPVLVVDFILFFYFLFDLSKIYVAIFFAKMSPCCRFVWR